MADTIHTGLIGFGISGQVFHAPFLTTVPGMQLDLVVERHSSKASEQYPGLKVVRSEAELLEDPAIDLVVITTPNESHFPLAAAAIAAGKHVVVEKPFTISSPQARELIRMATERHVVLSAYHNRRYVGDFRTITEILERQLLGDIAEFEAHYDRYRLELRPGAWREQDIPGSGILYDLGSHLIDQALCLFGLPSFITASVRNQRPGARTVDYFDLRLDYDFTTVRLKSGMLVHEQGPRYMIHGIRGSFVKYGEDPQEALLRAGQKPLGEDWGKEGPEHWGILHTDFSGVSLREPYPTDAGNYGDYYRDLFQTIREGVPLKVRAEDGYNVIRIIELALQSSLEGRTLPCTDLI